MIRSKRTFITENPLLYTLSEMYRLEKKSLENDEFIKFINNNFKDNNNLSWDIWNYIRNNFKYTSDTPDELLISPAKMLILKQGDCDDFAMFAKTILDYFKKDNYYLLFSKKQNESPTHIAVFLKKEKIVLDPTNLFFNTIPKTYEGLNLCLN